MLARPESPLRPAYTGTRKELSSPANGASALVTSKPWRTVTRDECSHMSCLSHGKKALVKRYRSLSHPSCDLVRIKSLDYLEATWSPRHLSTCLPRTWDHRNDQIPNILKSFPASKKGGSVAVRILTRRTYKISTFVGRDGAVSIPVSTVLDADAELNFMH